MRTTQILCPLLALLSMAIPAESLSADPPRLAELFEVGQIVGFAKNELRRYSVTVYTKQRKLEILARYEAKLSDYTKAKKEYELLTTRRQEIAAAVIQVNKNGAKEGLQLEEEHRLVSQLRSQARKRMGDVPYETKFHRVIQVGQDFVSLAAGENRSRIIPVSFIDELIFDGVEGKTREVQEP